MTMSAYHQGDEMVDCSISNVMRSASGSQELVLMVSLVVAGVRPLESSVPDA